MKKKYCNCLYPCIGLVYAGKDKRYFKDTICDLPMYDQEDIKRQYAEIGIKVEGLQPSFKEEIQDSSEQGK